MEQQLQQPDLVEVASSPRQRSRQASPVRRRRNSPTGAGQTSPRRRGRQTTSPRRARSPRGEGEEGVDAQLGLPKAQIDRLARLAGAAQVNPESLYTALAYANNYLTEILRATTAVTESARRVTIFPEDVQFALNSLGTPFYGKIERDAVSRRCPPGSTDYKDCLVIAYAPFTRVVRQLVNNEGLRISPGTFEILQQLYEQRIIRIFRRANKLAQYYNRVRIFQEDIQVAEEICNS